MKRIVLVLTILTGCSTGLARPSMPHPPKSKAVTALVIAASVVSIGFVAASGSQGPQ